MDKPKVPAREDLLWRQKQVTAGHANRRLLQSRQDAVGVQVRRYYTTCSSYCSCVCHRQRWANTPDFMHRALGQLFVDYAGIPLIRPTCNDKKCTRRSSPYLDLEYWFPTGLFWSQIFRVHYNYESSSGPQFQLTSLRRIPRDAPAMAFAISGNIDGLKDLFGRGLASPRDVDDSRGYSLLRVRRAQNSCASI